MRYWLAPLLTLLTLWLLSGLWVYAFMDTHGSAEAGAILLFAAVTAWALRNGFKLRGSAEAGAQRRRRAHLYATALVSIVAAGALFFGLLHLTVPDFHLPGHALPTGPVRPHPASAQESAEQESAEAEGNGSSDSGAPRELWIDSDPACTVPGRNDVDDCLALAAALKSEAVRIRGISTVFGNAELAQSDQVARELVRDVAQTSRPGAGAEAPPVYRGAARGGDAGMGMLRASAWPESDAALAMAEALTETRMTILALGPLTNIATVLQHHPALADRIVELVLVGGTEPGKLLHPGDQWWYHFRDFNVAMDPSAVSVVLDSDIPITLVPFAVASQVMVTEADLEMLSGGDKTTAQLGAQMTPWLRFWQQRLGREGFYPFDALALGYLVQSEDFAWHRRRAETVHTFLLDPIGLGYRLIISGKPDGISVGRAVRVVHEVDERWKDRFLRMLLRRESNAAAGDGSARSGRW